MTQQRHVGKVKNSNGLGNADEREHNRARIMPSGHCMTNGDNRLLNRLLKKNFGTLRQAQHDRNIVNHFNFVSVRSLASRRMNVGLSAPC
jgi:hypothetical protein